jgi:hypothetical protein
MHGRGDHGADKDHSSAARELPPLRAEDALGDSLIRRLRDCNTRRQGENKRDEQHAS